MYEHIVPGNLEKQGYFGWLANHQKHQKSGVGDVASEQLVVDCFGTSCPGAEEWWSKWDKSKMWRRPSSQDWMDVVSWFFHDFVPISFKSEGNKSSGVKLEQLEVNMSVVSLQVTPEWCGTNTHITFRVGWASRRLNHSPERYPDWILQRMAMESVATMIVGGAFISLTAFKAFLTASNSILNHRQKMKTNSVGWFLKILELLFVVKEHRWRWVRNGWRVEVCTDKQKHAHTIERYVRK